MSEPEPELGLGVVAGVEPARIAVDFPATGEKRLYALGTPVLVRVQFRPGETIVSRDGAAFVIEAVDEERGLLTYLGQGKRVREDEISDVAGVRSPSERLLGGQVDEGAIFNLRYRALRAKARFRQSEVRGFLGGRLELIPHQFYLLREVASRQMTRVLLADEVGLGKTIEACLILQRLLAVGKARRVLILIPESLTHQWFVELLRRFNLWFSIYDEERCFAIEQSDPGHNPFLASQLVLCSLGYLAGHDTRRDQAVAAGWDVLVIDEAHHLAWSPDEVSPEYALVERLARRSVGLLLLTATPTQLGLAGHFGRLRLLDPDRYDDYNRFRAEMTRYGLVAAIVGRIMRRETVTPEDHAALKTIFNRDPARLEQHLEALTREQPGAREALIKTLLDQHGTGRVMFRNTRAAVGGFPERMFCPVRVDRKPRAGGASSEPAVVLVDESRTASSLDSLRSRIARELRAEEEGEDDGIRYAYKGDPRIDWLAAFLLERRSDKVLLICKSPRKVVAIETALRQIVTLKVGLFHEELPLVRRDRNAAWFAEPDGAQLLLCSEIGSEGRNFQFSHHLVLFDLPLNPGLLEQRIGRLDRIGQTETIRIHVPFIAGSSQEAVMEWYHRGLDAFEHPLHGGDEYEAQFKNQLLRLALAYGGRGRKPARDQLEALIEETVRFRQVLRRRMEEGRDRLLELNSFNREVAEKVIERIRAVDADPFLKEFLGDLLDHFGVRVQEHEEGDVFLDPRHAFVEAFPAIPPEGMLATFDRRRAIIREDIRFISADHPLVQEAIDLLIQSRSGTSAFGVVPSDRTNLLLEAIFVLEAVADSRWHVDQFLSPTPIRVVVDVRGHDLTDECDGPTFAARVEDADAFRFFERPEVDAATLGLLVESANDRASEGTRVLKDAARARAAAELGAEVQRLIDLRKINDHVRPQEITLAREQLEHTAAAIDHARLRLDAVRLIIETPSITDFRS